MSAGFSNDFKELVRSRTDLVHLVGEAVSLKALRGGGDYIGLCPFHDDHNPSFHVYPDRQSYRCWVCTEGGDCFSWVMKREGVDFRQALEMLAERANLEMPKSQRRGTGESPNAKKQLLEILDWAEKEFHRFFLRSSEADRAREYMRGRGFTSETIAQYRIGCHPNDWDWLLSRARGKYTPEQLFAARLVGERRGGAGYRDEFIDRVMFPIRDERGRAVAFGGRILPDSELSDPRKYVNSSESLLFTKGRLVYGLDVAREAVRKSDTAIVVEGYTDCMMARQCGVENVVGTLGTALTEGQVGLLKRFARKVVLVYDGDRAGRDNAERVIAKFLAQEVDLRILTLPDELDPADFFARRGAEEFRALAEHAPEALDYKLQAAIGRIGLETIDARHRVLDEMVDLLVQAPRLYGTEREAMILDRLARRVAVPEQKVRARLKEARSQRANRSASPAGANVRIDSDERTHPVGVFGGKATRDDLLECELLEIIFAAPETIETVLAEVSPDEFRNPSLKALLGLCRDLFAQGTAPSYERVTAALEDPELKRLAVAIDHSSREKQLAQKIRDETRARADASRRTLLQQLLGNLKWRRHALSHEQSKGQLARLAGSAATLNPEAKALLRQATEFNQKRMNKQ